MQRKFIANLGFLILLNMLIKPFWILCIDRTVQNVVGPSEYGVYFALFNFSFLFQIILDFGINNFNNRLIAQQPDRIRHYFASALIAKCIFSVIYTVIVLLVATGLNYSGYQFRILGLLILYQILQSFYTFLRSNIAAMHLFRTDSVLSVLDKSVASIVCIFLLWGNIPGFTFSIESFLWVQIGSYALAIAVAYIIVLKKSVSIHWKFETSLIKEIAKKSYPFALLGFLMTVYYRIDGVMIQQMLGSDGNLETGIYASAFRLLDAMSILGFLFAGILLPMFSRMLEQKEPVKPLLELSFKLMLVTAAASGISFIFFRNQIMNALYTHADAYYGSVFGWLMISFINISIIYIYGTVLTANGSLRSLNFIAAGGMLINIVLNIFLIPEKHAEGAAIATVFTQVAVMGAHIIIAHKLLSLPWPVTLWMRSILFLAAATVCDFFIARLHLPWMYGLLFCLLADFILSLAAGLLPFREIPRLLKKPAAPES